jgi:hypothetical protein
LPDAVDVFADGDAGTGDAGGFAGAAAPDDAPFAMVPDVAVLVGPFAGAAGFRSSAGDVFRSRRLK